IVQKQGSSLSFLNSVTTPTTQTELLGTTFGSITATFTNPAIAARYPLDYGYALGDAFAGSATTLNINGNIIVTADGRGTLKLPYGNTYNNVLMVKSVQSVTASVFIIQVANISTTTYQFYHASSKFPVLTVSRSSTTFSTQTTLSSSASVNKAVFVIGVKENELNQLQFTLAPNPATKQVNIQLQDNSLIESITLKDCLGRELMMNYHTNTLNTESIKPGIYFVQVKAGAYTGVKRLVITQ
ncbi:MAG: T9SS type A sorting domain-containing protein, partial [Bacteroidia bacterium]|nr:T9SS type A sorting domain-containing protein [Bacteroidia bacterium]